MISISEINGISKQGVRENNEDYIKFYVDNNQANLSRVIVLCDGMGGHAHGEIASKIVAESVFAIELISPRMTYNLLWTTH